LNENKKKKFYNQFYYQKMKEFEYKNRKNSQQSHDLALKKLTKNIEKIGVLIE